MLNLTPIIIVFLVIVAPLWIIFHYTTMWKSKRGLTAQDESLLADLWQVAQKLETRLSNLESVLDQDTPGWRKSAATEEPAASQAAASGPRQSGRA